MAAIDQLDMSTAISEVSAKNICDKFNSDPYDDWNYEVVPFGDLFKVKVFDDEGFLGYL